MLSSEPHLGNDRSTHQKVHWAMELSQFDIKYHPRTAIKAQALMDFIVEFTLPKYDNPTNETE